MRQHGDVLLPTAADFQEVSYSTLYQKPSAISITSANIDKFNSAGPAFNRTYQKLDGYRHLFEVKDQPRRIAHEGVTTTVQAFRYNRNAAQSDELHRRFWVGSVAELLLKISAWQRADKFLNGPPQFRSATVLTHREDLIEQLERHVQEFNSSRNDLYIRLRESEEYAEAASCLPISVPTIALQSSCHRCSMPNHAVHLNEPRLPPRRHQVPQI